MPKDRLAELRAAQSNQVVNDAAIEIQEVDNKFSSTNKTLEDVEEVHCLLSKMESHVEKVKSKYANAITLSHPEKDWKQKVDVITATVKKTAGIVKTKLQTFEKYLKENANSRSNSEYRIIKIQYSTMSRKYVDIMTQFKTIQPEYRAKCKEKMQR